MQILHKGLTFSPTPTNPPNQHMIKQFDEFAKSLRLICTYQNRSLPVILRLKPTIHKNASKHFILLINRNSTVENYIYNTKEELDKALPTICEWRVDNLTSNQRKIIKRFQKSRQIITIKPADKNLGIVIMDTDDYLAQCANILKDHSIYRLADSKTSGKHYSKSYGNNKRHQQNITIAILLTPQNVWYPKNSQEI